MIIDCCNLSLSLSKEVISVFKKYVQDDAKKSESGGIMTGKVYENLIEIINCSEPTVFDKQSRYNFNRSYKSAQNYINKKFEESKGEEIYLGEWHTHPEGTPTPSNIDIKDFNKTLNKNKLNSNIHFMIIVGRTSIYLGIYFEKKRIKNLIVDLS